MSLKTPALPTPSDARIYVPQFGNPLEHAIVRGLIARLNTAGFVPVAVWDSEVYLTANEEISNEHANRPNRPWVPTAAMSVRQVLDAVFNVDADCTIHFARAAALTDWGRFGVLVVQGNQYDMISNYHCSKEHPAWEEAIDGFSNGLEKAAITFHTGDELVYE